MINTIISFLSVVLMLPVGFGILLIILSTLVSLVVSIITPLWLSLLNNNEQTLDNKRSLKKLGTG